MKKLIVVISEDAADLNYYLKTKIKSGFCFCSPNMIDTYHPIHIRQIIRSIIEWNSKIAIGTNSPYVLGEINNLLYARNVAKMNPAKADEIKAIIPEKYWIEECEAYEIIDGKPVSIYDEELQLIKNEALDEASRRLNDEYDRISHFEI